ncbi:MAG: selenoneine synthase SenA [Gammaproteobacteria bacterium]|nr:selenoneine synthase SenA [Gammaproteobacteria bacterium]
MALVSPEDLILQLTDARARTCALIDQLSEEQLMGPRLPTINPLRWEIGHAAYFYEFWILRNHFKESPLISGIDELFDSIHIPHESRWDLKLPTMSDTIKYMQQVKDRVVYYLSNGQQDPTRDYLTQYAIFHEDMHCEAFTYTRQTLEYPEPKISLEGATKDEIEIVFGDASIPGGKFFLGAEKSDNFVFDNEKWSHEQIVKPFKISKLAVTNEEFERFVNLDGYKEREYWCESGWEWLIKNNINHPVYWRIDNDTNTWHVRLFDKWKRLNAKSAVVNINWYEANAYCKWAKRRLPTELEWEVAASAIPSDDGLSLKRKKRFFPWGNDPLRSDHANFNGERLGPVNVNAKATGDSAFGCRQMLGNVWEWTSSVFSPYPDFTPDMYEDYSQPLFGKTRVLRGGCWATRGRLMRNSWRNYYGPERNDVFAGFRTCALD